MKKVLIVDDSDMIRNQLKQIVIDQGLECIAAADGKEGLDAFEANTDVSLIITDVNMPNLSGLEMIEQIRNNDAGKETTIFVLTSGEDPDSVQKGKSMGVKAWIVKPINPETIKMGLNRFISMNK